MNKRPLVFALSFAFCCTLAACGGGGGGSSNGSGSGTPSTGAPGTGGPGGGTTTPPTDPPAGRIFSIEPGENASAQALSAAIEARPGDVIDFACGFYQIESTMLITATEDITVQGCGINDTVLSFRTNNAPEGFLIDNVRGIRIRDLTVADTDGNAFELRSVDHGTLERVRAFWSSAGGRSSMDPITAANYQDGRLDVQCTDPPTLDPRAPENANNPEAQSPDYTVSQNSGRYGIYPVKSRNILVNEAESIGASDAGIYVGQTNTAIIQNSRAVYNVFGFEIENVQGGEYANNVAECNTGGFLIYDLDNITQYGERSRMHGNVANMNNTYNFTEGGFVANVPPGSGMITLAYDRIDVFNNTFSNNNTGGIIHASYELFPEGAGRPSDNKLDFYTEGMRIFNNNFKNNGNSLPAPTTNDIQNSDVARLLPALVGAKTLAACTLDPSACPVDAVGGFRGAHIVWDGLLDDYDADCPFPKDASGNNVPSREDGKPIHTNEHPNPACHYNKYKFDDANNKMDPPRIQPEWFASCIDDNNVFDGDSLTYTNFNGTRGVDAAIAASGDPAVLLDPALLVAAVTAAPEFPARLDISPHDCVTQYGDNLELLEPVVIPEFVPSGNLDPAPSEEEIAAVCDVPHSEGVVNFDAAGFNCPRLDQYNLFSDPQDPSSAPNGNGGQDSASGGVPFVLNTKLFSDYSAKYRVLYLPPDSSGSATAAGSYNAPGAGGPNAGLEFPVGTIIAKTFSFPNTSAGPNVVEHVETRLLIKREREDGLIRWAGLPYIWQTDNNGNRFATLQLSGGSANVSWNYEDVDTGATLQGNAPEYSIPNANQCVSCHSNQDREAGAPPIGLKVRNLNRPYSAETLQTTGQGDHPIRDSSNQLKYLCDNGYLSGCPDFSIDANSGYATNVERSPKFKVPGDAGFAANTDADIEARARAWLEVNCQHCHNPQGFAANTGYYLDVFRPVNTSYGICKGPTATGAEGSDGRAVDIQPENAMASILEFRISETADSPAARMPPLARSVVSVEGHDLIEQWINDVVTFDENRYPGSSACNGTALPTPQPPAP